VNSPDRACRGIADIPQSLPQLPHFVCPRVPLSCPCLTVVPWFAADEFDLTSRKRLNRRLKNDRGHCCPRLSRQCYGCVLFNRNVAPMSSARAAVRPTNLTPHRYANE